MVLHKNSLWLKTQTWADNHNRLATLLVISMLAVAAGVVGAAYFYTQPDAEVANQPAPQAAKKEPAAPAQKYYSPLSGVEVANQAATKRQVTAVMIENSQTARPQSGIKPAGIIYEAIAEGGITRFLTLHQEDRPALIGPVRSLRPYYIDWLAPFDASVAHVGGSKNALNEIRNGSYKDIDQFFNGSYFWRAKDRAAPHNVYTNFDKLDALNQKKGYTSSTFTPFPRKLDSPAAKPNVNKINITISGPIYNSVYNYDAGTDSYLRSEGGAPHNDREAGRLSPKVVIVIKVPTQKGLEDGYREQMTTTGYNTAYIFQDGIVVQGFWRKSGKKSQIEFYDHAARPIALNAGQTWVTVIAPDKSVKWQ
jgi:hypothetical protein